MDCDQCVVATLHGKPMFTKVSLLRICQKKSGLFFKVQTINDELCFISRRQFTDFTGVH